MRAGACILSYYAARVLVPGVGGLIRGLRQYPGDTWLLVLLTVFMVGLLLLAICDVALIVDAGRTERRSQSQL